MSQELEPEASSEPEVVEVEAPPEDEPITDWE